MTSVVCASSYVTMLYAYKNRDRLLTGTKRDGKAPPIELHPPNVLHKLQPKLYDNGARLHTVLKLCKLMNRLPKPTSDPAPTSGVGVV